MIKKLFFLSVFTLLIQFTSHAQPVWQNVGNPGFSAAGAYDQSLALNNGIPYVAFRDQNKQNKTSVMKFDGTNWVYVGIQGFSASTAIYQSLAFDGNTPYVAYKDYANSQRVSVMKFDGTNWVNVGSAGFSAGVADYISLAINNSIPYVAYRDGGNSNKATVMKFDGTNWVNVGSAGFSSSTANYLSLAFDSYNRPSVAFQDFAQGGKTTVMILANNSFWVNYGSPGFSVGSASYQSMVFYNNTLYVAYSDGGYYSRTAIKYFSNGSWVNAGPASITNTAYYQSLATDGTSIYLACRSSSNGNKTEVRKYNVSQSNLGWTPLYSSGNLGISAGTANYQSIAAENGVPFVAYQDGANSNKTTVLKYDVQPCGVTAISAGTQTACSENIYTQEVTITFNDAPSTGTLDVNGQSFLINNSPQTVTLTGLTANGAVVNVTAEFSDDPSCALTEPTLFTAPNGCAFTTALHFDGVNDYVESWSSVATLLPTGNSARTVDFWVQTNQTTGLGNIVSWGIGNETEKRSSFVVRNGNAAFVGGVRDVIGTISISDGIPHHVAISYDGTTNTGIKIYVDGVLDPGPYTYGWTNGLVLNTTNQNLTFGTISPDAAGSAINIENFEGILDDVRIWNKELNASEVAAIKGNSVPVNSQNLVAYFDFEEGIAFGDNSLTGGNVTSVIDLTGNYSGTVTNFARKDITSNWVTNGVVISTSAGISLSGNGVPIENGATPELNNHTSFGKSVLNSAVTREFTITNNGPNYLILNGTPLVSISGSTDFTISSLPQEIALEPGASTTFEVQYLATTTDESATIVVPSTDPESPFSFKVGGSLNVALDFDGINDWISGSDAGFPDDNEPRTFEAWIKFASVSVHGNILAYGAHGLNATENTKACALAVHQNGKLVFWTHNNDVFGSRNVLDDKWHHVAATYDGTGVRFYVDGVLDATRGISTIDTELDGFFGISKRYYSDTWQFNGMIDEVRLWNRALCQAEIQGRMHSSLQGNENGLVLYYDFEEGVPGGNNTSLPSNVYDKAGAKHGNMSGFLKNAAASNWNAGNEQTEGGLVTGTSVTWNGSTSSDWNMAANWTPNTVPGQCNDIIIPETANDPTFGDNQAVNSIEIQSGASLTVSTGGCLWVGSTFTNEGDFALQATATNYAQYQGPQVEGTLEQVIGEEGWHSIASPFIDAKLGDITFDQGAVLSYDPDPLKSNIHYYDPGTWQQTPPTTWSEAWGTWKSASGIQAAFDGSVAYNLYFDKYFMSGTFPITMSVSGTFRSMSIIQQLNGANGGWNLMSNPFPSVVSWEKLYDNSDIQPYYYVWDADATNWRAVAGDGTSVPASAQASSTQYIAPYQSVFVRTTSGQSTNSFDEADNIQGHLTSSSDKPTSCIDALANPFYKTGEETGVLRLQTTAQNGTTDELLIRFDDTYSEGYDYIEDATKFFSMNTATPSIYTIIDEKACVISSYPYPDLRAQSIPLGYTSTSTGEIKIELTEQPENMVVVLEDTELEIFHNLKTAYAFSTTNVDEAQRFKLHVGSTNSNIYSYLNGDQLVYIENKEIHFLSNPELEGGDIELINMSIKTLARAEFGSETILNVSSYPAGVYLVIVKKRGQVYRQKIIIQ